MKRYCLTALALSLMLALGVHAANVEIRSSRKVSADVAEVESGQVLRVKVSFLAVSTLTTVANERVSRLLARSFVEQAIQTARKSQEVVDFTQARMASCSFSTSDSGRICTVSYDVPTAALVKRVGESNNRSVDANWTTFTKACTADSKQALEDFRSSCYRDLRVAEAAFIFEIGSHERSKEVLRREIKSAFQAMADKANQDEMLLTSEKDELVKRINSVKSYLLKKLGEGKPSEKTSLISQGRFSKPEYKGLLLSDEVLLTTGGCRIFDKGGKKYVVAVGCTEVREDSPHDRIRRKRVAHEKARTAVIEARRTDVWTHSQSSQKAVVRHTNGKESSEELDESEQTTHVKAADYVDDMNTVATWYSSDGKLYFLALGCMYEVK